MIDSLSTGIKEIAATFRWKPRRQAGASQDRRLSGSAKLPPPLTGESRIVSSKVFRQVLCQERKRSERSRKTFLLMLVCAKSSSNGDSCALKPVIESLDSVIRETDILGWLETDLSLGVIFNELGSADIRAAIQRIDSKVVTALQTTRTSDFQISFYTFPQNLQNDSSPDRVIYPDLFELDVKRKTSLLIKRAIDIAGSVLALTLLSPLFAILALAIKLTSQGPVFFRQERLGQFQVPFVFLKFRSMRVAQGEEIHKEYVRNFIAGRQEPNSSSRGSIFKITNDPRVTGLGKFMRRTSLDELPQFWNVFKGEMSLVGPRPPIRYEIEAYDLWHSRRLLEAKPGITGLWQVHGRSRTTFDEMVRLDLRYARTWSPLSDLRILLKTPRAVFSGRGAC